MYRDDNHLLWDADRDAWVRAEHVHPGDRLGGADGKLRIVLAARSWAEARTVYNLTVANTHTFYVQAGNASVLVHNDGGFDWEKRLEDLKKDWDSGNRDGDGYHAPRGNQAENREFKDALRSVERNLGRQVTPAERRALHDRITGQGYDYHRIIDEPRGMFGGC
ncbi:polymorphic toxin-type HINT domain-containing protein [Streptomyces lavendofoliae]|uniref:polymorphic toxin-type HINT domain-containing protein n=1 Tax=Streptomyces lavendofoliae TaxID=67314 RepID=UPI003D90023C